jgi:pimeloyl-ACP methyl ester carboxylesterase
MGGQIASLYAGARPQRVRKLVLLDSLFLPDEPPARVVKRFRSWLEHQNDPRAPRTYASFEELAQRVRRRHPQLSPEKALFVARCWAREDGHGRVLLSADPRHSLDSPRPYRSDESEALWCEITAPTLFLDAAESQLQRLIPAEEKLRRRALIRDHRTIVIPDAGHMLHFDAPDAAAAAIAAFLNG